MRNKYSHISISISIREGKKFAVYSSASSFKVLKDKMFRTFYFYILYVNFSFSFYYHLNLANTQLHAHANEEDKRNIERDREKERESNLKRHTK